MIQGLDHIALGVVDFDGRCEFLTETMGLELRRTGTRYSTGTQIAFLADPVFKIELIETSDEEAGMLHLAFRVDDVEAEYENLLSKGLKPIREPHELAAAKAKTALLQAASGLNIQIIQYAPDSPDL